MLKDERFISKMVEGYTNKPIQMFAVEELQDKKYNLNQLYVGKIVKYYDRKSANRPGEIVKEGMILIKLQDRIYLDIETGKCYKSWEYFQDEAIDSKSTKLKLIPTQYNKESNAELTLSQIKSIAHRSRQFSK